MEGAGMLLIALAIVLMLVPPIHVTMIRPHAAPAAIGAMLRDHHDGPVSACGFADPAYRADAATAHMPVPTDTPFPDQT